jgi:poly(3-hydroxyalkanoate) synthetase
MIISKMMTDAIIASLPFLTIESHFQHETDWEVFNDHSIITMIKEHPNTIEAKSILKRIETRDLYKLRVINNPQETSSPKVHVGYHNQDTNPLLDLWFYHPDTPLLKTRIDLEQDIGPISPCSFHSTRSLV